jgi:tRNA(fMet)-specific endonuclease VapC
MPLLDTCFVIDVLRGEPKAAALLDLLRQGSAPLGTSPHTHFELYAGIGRSKRPQEELQRVEAFLDSLAVFQFGPEAARQAGLLDAQLARDGETVSLIDLMIAATAMQAGQDLVTRNHNDFDRIPGLRVLRY